MKRLHWFFLATIFILPLPACAYSGGPVKGTILEEGTDKPIPGTIIVVRWEGTAFSFAHTQSVCIHVESTRTDDKGRFRIPAWRASVQPAGVHDLKPLITAHKPGYEAYLPPGYTRTEEFKQNIRYLKPFTGGREERLNYLLRVLGNTSCGVQDESEKNLIPLRKVLYEEAQKLAQTKEDQKTVEAILYRLEILESGFEEAGKRHLERAQGR